MILLNFPRNASSIAGRLAALKDITLFSVILILLLPAPSLCGDVTRRLGYVTMDSAVTHAPFAAAFRESLRNNGYIEGQNVTIVWRFAANDAKALPRVLSELVGLKPDVLVADTTQAALAAKRATKNIPIVIPTSGDLIGVGLVENLARPEGNITGFTLMSGGLIGKRLALLKEMVPRAHRIAVLMNPENPASAFQLQEAQTAAPGLSLLLRPIAVRVRQDLEPALASVAGKVDAIYIADDPLLDESRTKIGALAIQYRLASICGYRMPEDNMCLMWYGPDLSDMYRRAATYVSRIFAGAKPGDLPVEQPIKFLLTINARTAATIAITVPQSLMVTADDVLR